jgi:integrase
MIVFTKSLTLWECRMAIAGLRAAEIPHVRFHDLRHSCATLLLAQGVPARVVQDILGHSAIRVTMDVYSHVLPSMRDDAAKAMDSVFGA